ncbi:hypothetical protein KR009_002666, partial [Drosophila setifemur]
IVFKTSAVMFNIPKLTARILRWIFCYASFMGLILFRLNNRRGSENIKLEISQIPSKLKWLVAFYRLVTVCAFLNFYASYLSRKVNYVEIFNHIFRLIVAGASCLCMIRIQLFLGPDLVRMANDLLGLFRKVRAMKTPKKSGLGGGCDLAMIIIAMTCHAMEYPLIAKIFHSNTKSENILTWWFHVNVIVSGNLIIYISSIWYFCLRTLYSELNEYVESQLEAEGQPMDRSLRLKECLNIYRMIYSVAQMYQNIFDGQVFMCLMQNVAFGTMTSYKVILDMGFTDYIVFCAFLKICISVLIFMSSVQGAVDEFKYTQELTKKMSQTGDFKEWDREVEIFVINLNLYKLRVRPCGLFDVSKKLFLICMSGLAAYLVFIIQLLMQEKSF